jgi:hypothetical protein
MLCIQCVDEAALAAQTLAPLTAWFYCWAYQIYSIIKQFR